MLTCSHLTSATFRRRCPQDGPNALLLDNTEVLRLPSWCTTALGGSA